MLKRAGLKKEKQYQSMDYHIDFSITLILNCLSTIQKLVADDHIQWRTFNDDPAQRHSKILSWILGAWNFPFFCLLTASPIVTPFLFFTEWPELPEQPSLIVKWEGPRCLVDCRIPSRILFWRPYQALIWYRKKSTLERNWYENRWSISRLPNTSQPWTIHWYIVLFGVSFISFMRASKWSSYSCDCVPHLHFLHVYSPLVTLFVSFLTPFLGPAYLHCNLRKDILGYLPVVVKKGHCWTDMQRLEYHGFQLRLFLSLYDLCYCIEAQSSPVLFLNQYYIVQRIHFWILILHIR